jgi:hypothetical protein
MYNCSKSDQTQDISRGDFSLLLILELDILLHIPTSGMCEAVETLKPA